MKRPERQGGPLERGQVAGSTPLHDLLTGPSRATLAGLGRLRPRTEHAVRLAWQEGGIALLQASGIAQLFAGIVGIRTALGLAGGTAPASFTLLLAGGSAVVILTGALTCARRRRELVERLIGVLTGGAFAFSLVFLSRPDGDRAADALLTITVLSGAAGLLVLVFGEFFTTGASAAASPVLSTARPPGRPPAQPAITE